MNKFDSPDTANSWQPRPDKFDRREDPSERHQKSVVRVDYDVCEDTGACAMVCPEDVFKFEGGHTQVIKGEACTECWICVENCTSGAIEIG